MRAFNQAAATARQETSTAVTSAPARAAVTPTTPDPVQMSSPRGVSARRRTSSPTARASSHESLIGRNTPGTRRSRTPPGLSCARRAQTPMVTPSPPTASQLRATFDAAAPLTVGLEEELMLLDGETLDLLPRALELLDGLDGRFKPELPAAQLEIVTPPCATAAEAIGVLGAARRDLAAAAARRMGARLAGAGVHPFAPARGELNRGERYDLTADEYGDVARRQLVCALQVHVAVGGAERTLAVYNALRSHVPEVAAL